MEPGQRRGDRRVRLGCYLVETDSARIYSTDLRACCFSFDPGERCERVKLINVLP